MIPGTNVGGKIATLNEVSDVEWFRPNPRGPVYRSLHPAAFHFGRPYARR